MRLSVRVKPNAKKSSIEKLDAARFNISVAEPAEKGKANEAVCRAVADYFGVSRMRVRIIAGTSSRNKKLEIV